MASQNHSRHAVQHSCWCLCMLWVVIIAQLQVTAGAVHQQKDGPSRQLHAETPAAAERGLAQQHQQQQTAELPGQPDPKVEALTRFLVSLGAEVNVAVRRLPGFGRTTVAPKDIQKGDVLVQMPVELAYNTSGPLEGVARQLLTDMLQQQHPLAPFFQALPGPSEVMSSITLPKTYLTILQDSSMELSVQIIQALADEEWHRHSPEFWSSLGPNMSRTNLTYAMALISTRSFGKSGGSQLIPVVEFANHQSNCRHFLYMENCTVTPALKQWIATLPARTQDTALAATAVAEATPASGATPAPAPACDRCGLAAAATPAGGADGGSNSDGSSSSGQCIVWRAGEAVSAGQHLCYRYKQMMLQDYALLQYGFLQEGPIAFELSLMDRPERSPATLDIKQVVAKVKRSSSGLPTKFRGTAEQIKQEIQRLEDRLQHLKAGEARVAAVAVDAVSDTDGRMLALLLNWRQQRLRAIESEVDRLRPWVGMPAGVATATS